MGIVLMYMMIVFPAKLYVIKVPLLFLLFIIQFRKVRVSQPVAFLVGAMCLSTLWGVVVGTFKSTSNPLADFTIGFLWPVASLFVLLPLLKKKNDFVLFAKYLFYGHAFIVLYDIAFVLSVIIGFSMINLYPEVETPFSFYGFTSRLNFDDNLNFITFTTPLYLFIWLSHYDIKVNRFLQTIILLLNVFLLVVSGRRSLMLTFVLAPFFVILFKNVFPKQLGKNVKISFILLLIIVAGALSYYYTIEPENFDGYVNTFTKAFDSDEEPIKYNQARILWSHFTDNFLFGEGAGVELPRGNGSTGIRFELSYLHHFTTGGIFGGLLYIYGLVGIFFYGFKMAKKRDETLMLFFSIAFLFSLIAHGTNPVLSSFDSMIPIFLGYAQINALYYYKTYIS